MGQGNNSIGSYLKRIARANSVEEKNELLQNVNALISSHREQKLLTELVLEAKRGNDTLIVQNQVAPPPDFSEEEIKVRIQEGRIVQFSW